jgi:organic hydroperoxide reductase OsmC/OhrA
VKLHRYETEVEWTGNDGAGTEGYKSYRRDHTVRSKGRPHIPGSSDPGFRGDPGRYNPEQLLVASLSACHMLWYLHLCAINGIAVHGYTDAAIGEMRENTDGSGEFVRVVLKPQVKIAKGADAAKAHALHEEANRLCFIARSVNFPVETAAAIAEV